MVGESVLRGVTKAALKSMVSRGEVAMDYSWADALEDFEGDLIVTLIMVGGQKIIKSIVEADYSYEYSQNELLIQYP